MKAKEEPSTKKYWVFVSYSSKDKKWGKWLHHRLENYPIPEGLRGAEVFDGAVLGKNLRPCFRDREELTGAADLGPAISKALSESRYLVVLCSKNSAQSTWVNKEIEDFRAMGGDRRILALILDGEPNALRQDAVPDEEECFPPALRYPHEPLAGDLRENGDGKERGFLKILAGAAQLDFDELYRRHERAQRRQRLILGGIATAVILSLTGLSLYAMAKQQEATRSAEAERLAKEEGRRELALSTMTHAYQSAASGRRLNGLRALAQTPSEARNQWPWRLAKSLNGGVPLRLLPEEIAFLDQGALKGSGLLEDARRLLASAPTNSVSAKNSNLVLTSLYGGRGGGLLSVKRGEEPPLFEYGTGTYDAVGRAIFSTDESCLLALTSALNTETVTVSAAGVVEPTDQFIYVIPIPTTTVPVRRETFLPSEELEESYDGDMGITGAGSKLVIAGDSKHSTLVAIDDEGKIKVGHRPLVDDYWELPSNFQAAFHHQNRAEQKETRARLISGDFGEETTKRILAAHDFGKGPEFLVVDYPSRTGELFALAESESRWSRRIDDEAAWEIWQAESGMRDGFTVGGDFTQGGTVLLCPWIDDRAVVFHGPDDREGIILPSGFAYAQDHSARPGGSEWRLSPDGSLVGVSIFHAPTARSQNGVVDAKTGQDLWELPMSMVPAIGWSREGRYFGTFDQLNRAIYLAPKAGASALAEVPYFGVDTKNLVRRGPEGSNLILVGNTLLRESDRRPLVTLPEEFYLSDDWEIFAARFPELEQKDASEFWDQEVRQYRIALAQGGKTETQAAQLLEFEIDYLTKQLAEPAELAPLFDAVKGSPDFEEARLRENLGLDGETPLLWLTTAVAEDRNARISDFSGTPRDPLLATALKLRRGGILTDTEWLTLSAHLAAGWPERYYDEISRQESGYLFALGQAFLDGAKPDRAKEILFHLGLPAHRILLAAAMKIEDEPFFFHPNDYLEWEKGDLSDSQVLNALVTSAKSAHEGRTPEAELMINRVREFAAGKHKNLLTDLLAQPTAIKNYWWPRLLPAEAVEALIATFTTVASAPKETTEAELAALIQRSDDLRSRQPMTELPSGRDLLLLAEKASTETETLTLLETRSLLHEKIPGDALAAAEIAQQFALLNNQPERLKWLRLALERSDVTGFRYEWPSGHPREILANAALANGQPAEALDLFRGDQSGDLRPFQHLLEFQIATQEGNQAQALKSLLAIFKEPMRGLVQNEDTHFRDAIFLARTLNDLDSRAQLVTLATSWSWLYLAGDQEDNPAHQGLTVLISWLLEDQSYPEAYRCARLGFRSDSPQAKSYLPAMLISCWMLNARETTFTLLSSLPEEERKQLAEIPALSEILTAHQIFSADRF